MNDNEEILSLQTNKPNIVKLDELRKLSSSKSPIFRRKLVQHFILYVIDSIISLIFVAPMVIAFWRGTWGLLDIHIHLFPPYATGVFGIVIHMCFVLMRQFIQDLFEEENERAKRDTAFVISRRLYTYTYSVISVMQWRGCWTAFDDMFIKERSNALVWVVVATMVSTFSLITLKSLTNSLATPCILILDSLDACYNIPTRYRVRIILLLALSPSKQTVIHIPHSKKTDISSLINYNAHPFQNEITGYVPSPFSVSKVESSTTVPKNIQDVIKISANHKELATTEEHLSQQSYNLLSIPVVDKNIAAFNNERQHDPFHSFKPQDISEVNLLAVSNVRFAPPAWIDLKDDRQRKRILKRSQRNLSAWKRYRYFYPRAYKLKPNVRRIVLV